MPVGLKNLYFRNLNKNRKYKKFEDKCEPELIINLFEECMDNENVEKINLCLQKKNIIIDNTTEETKKNNSEKRIKINNIKNINNCLYFLE